MLTPKRCVCKFLIALLVVPWAPLARASAYDGHPRLVVVLVVDQLRGWQPGGPPSLAELLETGRTREPEPDLEAEP